MTQVQDLALGFVEPYEVLLGPLLSLFGSLCMAFCPLGVSTTPHSLGFQDCLQKNHWFTFARPLSVDINTLPANFQMECIELQSVVISLPDLYKTSLGRWVLEKYVLLMLWHFGSIYIWELLLLRMKYREDFIKNLWWALWELTKIGSHWHRTEVMH